MTLQYIQVSVYTMQVTTLQHIQESVCGDWCSYVGAVIRLWAVQPKNCGSLPRSGKAFFSP